MHKVYVLDRVTERHPNVSKDDAVQAWSHCLRSTPDFGRDPMRYVAVGIDGKGRFVELVVIRKSIEEWIIIHAQTPPQEAIKRKLGLKGLL